MTEVVKDLAVHFASQVRIKCPECKKFRKGEAMITCPEACGAVWALVGGTTYRRL